MKQMQCPRPKPRSGEITLAHGSGGKQTAELIASLFRPLFCNEWLEQDHDGAVLTTNARRLAFTTDSFVVDPLFFPGGNIGDLAVNGTVNDISCCGARPLYLSAGFIIEEGFPLKELQRIAESMAKAAEEAGISIVTGDTKVVGRGKCDKIFINTSGIGILSDGISISPREVKPGDAVLVTGRIAEHGITILSKREHLGFDASIRSDTAPLNRIVSNLLAGVPEVHLLRDPTRGGLAGTLNEVALSAGVCIEIDETKIPISEPVSAACDLLGIDPLHVANEGVLVVILPEALADEALRLIHGLKYGQYAAVIGRVTACKRSEVVLHTTLGGSRIVDLLSGEQLPRIC